MVQYILAHSTPLAHEIFVLQPFVLVINREWSFQLSCLACAGLHFFTLISESILGCLEIVSINGSMASLQVVAQIRSSAMISKLSFTDGTNSVSFILFEVLPYIRSIMPG